ncbi:hypothetical protein D3C87_1921880 [compost metagenome]
MLWALGCTPPSLNPYSDLRIERNWRLEAGGWKAGIESDPPAHRQTSPRFRVNESGDLRHGMLITGITRFESAMTGVPSGRRCGKGAGRQIWTRRLIPW